jgi:prepilin-type N-terminal cleavage/methylation domain-containing protein
MSARCSRGFTLAETLVVLALLSMIVFSSWPLWDQTQRALQQISVALRQSNFELAAARLRADVQGAHALGTAPSEWSAEPLDLREAEGQTVRLGLRDGALERLELDPTGVVVARRVLFTGLLGWRWRAVSRRLLDIEATRAAEADIRPAAPHVLGKPGAAPRVTERLRLALRGAGGGRSW